MAERVVVKVGGSLLAWPELRSRLSAWLNTLSPAEVVLVPGGGAAADAVRQLDRVHGLGDETAHWLAIRAMTLNAHFLAALLPRARVVARLSDLATAWSANVLPILDCLPLLLDDELQPGKLPHTWAVTSDAIAARVARLLGARLVLLKSVTLTPGLDWSTAAQRGLVDTLLPTILEQGRPLLRAEAVNLRSWAVV